MSVKDMRVRDARPSAAARVSSATERKRARPPRAAARTSSSRTAGLLTRQEDSGRSPRKRPQWIRLTSGYVSAR